MIWIGGTSAVLSLIGTGISYYGQQEQAKSADSIANYNYEIQRRNAEQNKQIAAQQQVWQQQAFANNQATTARNASQASAVAQANANAANQNAAILENQGRAAESLAREQARRKRDENAKVLAMQRGRYAKSGVVNEGSPLSIMAETAGLLELGIQDAAYEADMTGRAFDRRAELSRFEGRTSLYEGALAGVDAKQTINQSIFDAGVSKYEAAAKQAGFAIQLNQAGVDRMAGQSTAQGLRSASYGTLLSGAGSSLSTAASAYGRYKDK
jgi:hypothetical protein